MAARVTTNGETIALMFERLEFSLVEQQRQVVRLVHRAMVKATPKDTGYASRWRFKIGGAPEAERGRPTLPRYPLQGDAEIDSMTEGMKLGDNGVMASPADYIRFLLNPSLPRYGSRQQPRPGWGVDAIAEAQQMFERLSRGGRR